MKEITLNIYYILEQQLYTSQLERPWHMDIMYGRFKEGIHGDHQLSNVEDFVC